MFSSPYCLLNIDPPTINNPPKLCLFSKNTNPRPYLTPLLFGARVSCWSSIKLKYSEWTRILCSWFSLWLQFKKHPGCIFFISVYFFHFCLLIHLLSLKKECGNMDLRTLDLIINFALFSSKPQQHCKPTSSALAGFWAYIWSGKPHPRLVYL